jgi:8-oxo-dGTP pyrophosphatase MutT (NUDIX family)
LRESSRGAEILLIRRAELEGDPWSGHMAFPGGRRNASDASLVETVVRETREEVGLELATYGTLIGRLSDLPAMSRGRVTGMVVSSFVFALRSDHPPLSHDEREVAEVLWTPLDPLARGENAGVYAYHHDGIVHELPCVRVGERVVWGLTFRMLQQLFEALRA